MTTQADLDTLLTWGEETATLAHFGLSKAIADALVELGTAVYAAEQSSEPYITTADKLAAWSLYESQQPVWNNYDETATEANANFVRFTETSDTSILSALSDWGQTLLEASLGIPLTIGDELDTFGMGLDTVFGTLGDFFTDAFDELDGLLDFIVAAFGTAWTLFVEGMSTMADLIVNIVQMDTEGIVENIMAFVDIQELVSKQMLEKEPPV